MFTTIKEKNTFKMIQENLNLLNPISLHHFELSKYAIILGYYPMSKSKFDIFINLDKNKKVGMLNRYILGLASKLGIYQAFIKDVVYLRQQHARYKKLMKESKSFYGDKDYWKKAYDRNQVELTKQYKMLLDMMLEELTRRDKTSYVRKKKLQKIKDNLQS